MIKNYSQNVRPALRSNINKNIISTIKPQQGKQNPLLKKKLFVQNNQSINHHVQYAQNVKRNSAPHLNLKDITNKMCVNRRSNHTQLNNQKNLHTFCSKKQTKTCMPKLQNKQKKYTKLISQTSSVNDLSQIVAVDLSLISGQKQSKQLTKQNDQIKNMPIQSNDIYEKTINNQISKLLSNVLTNKFTPGKELYKGKQRKFQSNTKSANQTSFQVQDLEIVNVYEIDQSQLNQNKCLEVQRGQKSKQKMNSVKKMRKSGVIKKNSRHQIPNVLQFRSYVRHSAPNFYQSISLNQYKPITGYNRNQFININSKVYKNMPEREKSAQKLSNPLLSQKSHKPQINTVKEIQICAQRLFLSISKGALFITKQMLQKVSLQCEIKLLLGPIITKIKLNKYVQLGLDQFIEDFNKIMLDLTVKQRYEVIDRILEEKFLIIQPSSNCIEKVYSGQNQNRFKKDVMKNSILVQDKNQVNKDINCSPNTKLANLHSKVDLFLNKIKNKDHNQNFTNKNSQAKNYYQNIDSNFNISRQIELPFSQNQQHNLQMKKYKKQKILTLMSKLSQIQEISQDSQNIQNHCDKIQKKKQLASKSSKCSQQSSEWNQQQKYPLKRKSLSNYSYAENNSQKTLELTTSSASLFQSQYQRYYNQEGKNNKFQKNRQLNQLSNHNRQNNNYFSNLNRQYNSNKNYLDIQNLNDYNFSDDISSIRYNNSSSIRFVNETNLYFQSRYLKPKREIQYHHKDQNKPNNENIFKKQTLSNQIMLNERINNQRICKSKTNIKTRFDLNMIDSINKNSTQKTNQISSSSFEKESFSNEESFKVKVIHEFNFNQLSKYV